jgi:hypothetical protein
MKHTVLLGLGPLFVVCGPILFPGLDLRQAEPKVAYVESGLERERRAYQGVRRGNQQARRTVMAGQRSVSPLLAFLLGVVVVGLGVLGYMLYERQHREVLKIDLPGFSGEISKDKGIDIEVDKAR